MPLDMFYSILETHALHTVHFCSFCPCFVSLCQIGELSRKLDDTVETLATQNCDVKNQIADVQVCLLFWCLHIASLPLALKGSP